MLSSLPQPLFAGCGRICTRTRKGRCPDLVRGIRLAQLDRDRRWAEYGAAHGDRFAIVDQERCEAAWRIPATEPLTEQILVEISAKLLTTRHESGSEN